MASWKKEILQRENGENVSMQTPEIISASRSTDIPAFYSDWFFHRLKIGYSAWTNPFNGVRSYVSFKKTRFIVFWSKNPKPLIPHLNELAEKGIGCYIQYSLNDYEKEGLEKGVPCITERIDTFKRLVDKLGLGGVVWRSDPLILTNNISLDDLLNRIEYIGNALHGYTEKLVFSFADIIQYRKVRYNLEVNNIHYIDWNEEQMIQFASELALLNKKWEYELSTCGEKIDLEAMNITHNSCIDDKLIIKRAYQDKILMDFLKVKIHPMPTPSLFGEIEPLPKSAIILPNGTYAIRNEKKDKGQREFCGCISSKDIGEYNTCVHLCEYCYANTSKETAKRNFDRHLTCPLSETITGK